jgi:hypothetical protein
MTTSYDWGTYAFPTPTVNGQLHVDPTFKVWEWNSALQTWEDTGGYQFEKVLSHHLLVAGFLAGSDIFAVGRRSGVFSKIWDEAFKLAFVELRDHSSGSLIARRAHMTKAQFLAWLPTVLALSGATYNQDAVMHIYEVVSPSLGIVRMNAWNALYGSFRGRDCYVGDYGNGRTGVPQRAGYAPAFQTYHGTDLDIRLMQYFYGSTPATSEPRACWSANNRKTLYRFPKQLGVVLPQQSPSTGRYVRNIVTDSWEPTNPAHQFEFLASPPSGANPAFIVRDPDGMSLSILNPQEATFGVKGVFGDAWQGREMMVAYLVRSTSPGNRVAFFIKPFGVTKCAFVFDPALNLGDYEVVATGKFDSQPRDTTFYTPTTGSGWIQQRQYGDGMRINRLLSVILQLCRPAGAGNPAHVTFDTAMIPDRIHFYLRHRETGLRGEESGPHIAPLRRKCTIPLAFTFNHA